MKRLVSLVILATLIIFLGVTFYKVVAPFLLPLFLAAVVTVLCQPMRRYFLKRMHGRERLAAALTTVTIVASCLIPLLVGVFIGSVQVYSLTLDTVENRKVGPAVSKVRKQLGQSLDQHALFERLQPVIEIVARTSDREAQEQFFNRHSQQLQQGLRSRAKELAERSLGIAAGKTFDILGASVSVLIALIMFGIALYYFLADGPALLAEGEHLIPVHIDYQQQLLARFDKVIRAIVLATFLSAIAQGLATAVALAIAGIPHFFILFILATLASMIPLTGAGLVWVPCAIWMATQGQWGAAIGVTVFGAAGVGTLDNVIRTYVLQSDARLHPLLAFVSVLGGLQAMGFWGVFIGPIVACFLHALIQIFNVELKEFSKSRFDTDLTTDSGDDDENAGAEGQPSQRGAASVGAASDSQQSARGSKPEGNVDLDSNDSAGNASKPVGQSDPDNPQHSSKATAVDKSGANKGSALQSNRKTSKRKRRRNR